MRILEIIMREQATAGATSAGNIASLPSPHVAAGDDRFKKSFPWFNTSRYWDDHILSMREQISLMQEEPLKWKGF